MWDKYGYMDSADKINTLAVNLRNEGDRKSIHELAEENGIGNEITGFFIDGKLDLICDTVSAAIGKIDVEAEDMQLGKYKNIIQDWLDYIKSEILNDEVMAVNVRMEKLTLKGCLAALLKWSFGQQMPIPQEIMKAAGVTAGRCTMGIPDMETAKGIIRSYYKAYRSSLEAGNEKG